MSEQIPKPIKNIYYASLYIPGLQSVSNEQMESNTFEMVKAGDQLSLRMSRQMTPWLLILQ